MPDFGIRQGDTAPIYFAALTDSIGTDWDIGGGAVVTFTMRHLASGTLVVDARPCTIESPTDKTVTYAWQPGDTDLAGLHIGEFRVTFSDAALETFPDVTYVLVQITQQTADLALPETLCSVDDLLAYISDLTADEALDAARTFIPRVEADAFNLLQHALIRKERTETGVPLLPNQVEIPLRYTPVVTVSNVQLDGQTVQVGSYALLRNGLRLYYPGSPTAFLQDPNLSRATITYIGGLDPAVAALIKPTLLARVARLVTKARDRALGTDRVEAERYMAQYLSEGFTADEREQLLPYASQAGALDEANDDQLWDPDLASPSGWVRWG